MGIFSKLFSGGRAAGKEERGEDVASRLDGLAQLDRKWSTESLRRRARDVFFAVQCSWIDPCPEIGSAYMTQQLMDRQRLRSEGLIGQYRAQQFENPLIEALHFVSFDEGD